MGRVVLWTFAVVFFVVNGITMMCSFWFQLSHLIVEAAAGALPVEVLAGASTGQGSATQAVPPPAVVAT